MLNLFNIFINVNIILFFLLFDLYIKGNKFLIKEHSFFLLNVCDYCLDKYLWSL